MYIQGSYFSTILQRCNSYVAVLPEKLTKNVRVVFLLHGIGSNESSWALNVPLVEYSKKYQVAFFCPAGGNSFYTDHANGEAYGEAIGKEFYEVMRALYRLNFERENVQLAGFSMGGYGAVLLGLRFSELYSQIGAFSPAFVFYKKERQEAHYQKVFSKGDYGSENDCVFQYQKLLNQKRPIPPIQFTCGKEDPLCEQTENVIQQINKLDPDAALTFYPQAGFHDFSLWNRDLVRFLEK